MTGNGNWLITKVEWQSKRNHSLGSLGSNLASIWMRGGNWIQREEERFCFKRAYVTPTGWKVALDGEQPPGILTSPGVGGQAGIIPCCSCGLALRLYKSWYQA